MITLLVFTGGLLIGSFVNAGIWRLRTKRSILWERSICPHCQHTLAATDLIPVVSWIVLHGRCRYCKKPISIQYPLVELLTASLFSWSLLAWEFSNVLSYIEFGFWLIFLSGLIFLAIYDLKWMLLPDIVLLPLIILAVVRTTVGLAFDVSMQEVWWEFVTAVISGGFFYLLFSVSGGRWMGGGDVKLAFLMGLLLGPVAGLVAFVLAFNTAALVSILLIFVKKLNRKHLIPFGPFLIGATIIAMLYGHQIFDWYIHLVTFS